MWNYPIQTVYDMHAACVRRQTQERLSQYGILRLAALTAQSNINERGVRSIENSWKKLFSQLEKASEKKLKPKASQQKSSGPKVVAQNKTTSAQKAASAASAFAMTGSFSPIR